MTNARDALCECIQYASRYCTGVLKSHMHYIFLSFQNKKCQLIVSSCVVYLCLSRFCAVSNMIVNQQAQLTHIIIADFIILLDPWSPSIMFSSS